MFAFVSRENEFSFNSINQFCVCVGNVFSLDDTRENETTEKDKERHWKTKSERDREEKK